MEERLLRQFCKTAEKVSVLMSLTRKSVGVKTPTSHTDATPLRLGSIWLSHWLQVTLATVCVWNVSAGLLQGEHKISAVCTIKTTNIDRNLWTKEPQLKSPSSARTGLYFTSWLAHAISLSSFKNTSGGWKKNKNRLDLESWQSSASTPRPHRSWCECSYWTSSFLSMRHTDDRPHHFRE